MGGWGKYRSSITNKVQNDVLNNAKSSWVSASELIIITSPKNWKNKENSRIKSRNLSRCRIYIMSRWVLEHASVNACRSWGFASKLTIITYPKNWNYGQSSSFVIYRMNIMSRIQRKASEDAYRSWVSASKLTTTDSMINWYSKENKNTRKK